METKVVVKAPNCKDEERLIIKPPYTIFGNTSIPKSFSIIMKVGGLKKMLEGLEGEDSFRIEIFSDKATEYSYIKKGA